MEGVTDMWVTGADWVSRETVDCLYSTPHASPSHIEHIRNAGSERTLFLIVSVKNHGETVPCDYYADTIVNEKTAHLTSGAQGTEREGLG
jgi:hypothetical protein